LPDGIFSNQNYLFGQILEDLPTEDLGSLGKLSVHLIYIFCGHLGHFSPVWYVVPRKKSGSPNVHMYADSETSFLLPQVVLQQSLREKYYGEECHAVGISQTNFAKLCRFIFSLQIFYILYFTFFATNFLFSMT
jgi:hypothetical protein